MLADPIDEQAFRTALGRFCTGVTVITADDGERFHGMTATAFSSVSLSPPMILVCVGTNTRMNRVLAAGKAFGVSILGQTQESVSAHFSGRANTPPPMTRLEEVPVVEGALAHLACRAVTVHAAGDHHIHIGEVVACHTAAGLPLLHYEGRYRGLKAEPSAEKRSVSDGNSPYWRR
ncbi:MAG: flavin reductase family protein [Rhodospirillaceae bacterium]|nr:flavin reductase family protein [Rhodospirillaceae bacterium]